MSMTDSRVGTLKEYVSKRTVWIAKDLHSVTKTGDAGRAALGIEDKAKGGLARQVAHNDATGLVGGTPRNISDDATAADHVVGMI